MANSAYIQQCSLCGRIIYGIGPLKQHTIACKKKMCNNCPDKADCPSKLWMQDCPKKKN